MIVVKRNWNHLVTTHEFYHLPTHALEFFLQLYGKLVSQWFLLVDTSWNVYQAASKLDTGVTGLLRFPVVIVYFFLVRGTKFTRR